MDFSALHSSIRDDLMTKGKMKTVTMSLVLTLCAAGQAGAANQGAPLEQNAEKRAKRTAISLEAKVARGDLDSMYMLAMMHIEGTMEQADYDTGVRMLKRAAAKGHKDSQRMYRFMDNAFSGEGC